MRIDQVGQPSGPDPFGFGGVTKERAMDQINEFLNQINDELTKYPDDQTLKNKKERLEEIRRNLNDDYISPNTALTQANDTMYRGGNGV